MIPKPTQSAGVLPDDDDVDLESLAGLEAAAVELDPGEVHQVEAHTAETATTEKDAPGTRRCPHCGKLVKDPDPHVEILCSQCWNPIPPGRAGAGTNAGRLIFGRGRGPAETGFYGGLGSVFAYPFGASGSLLTAMGTAIGLILLPVAMATALVRTTEQANVGTDHLQMAELTGIQAGLMGLFLLEVLFFVLVGLHALVEVTRTNSVGQDKPPPLVWNPTAWGETILGLAAVLAVNIALVVGTAWLTAPEMLETITSLSALGLDAAMDALETPALLTVVLILGFFFPMNLIALACGKLTQALNPVRIMRSIYGTHVHYVFLFILFVVLVVAFIGLANVVLEWFGGEMRNMQTAASAGNLFDVAAGLISWAVVMGAGFYCVYLIGRVLGLFARTFFKDLAFD